MRSLRVYRGKPEIQWNLRLRLLLEYYVTSRTENTLLFWHFCSSRRINYQNLRNLKSKNRFEPKAQQIPTTQTIIAVSSSAYLNLSFSFYSLVCSRRRLCSLRIFISLEINTHSWRSELFDVKMSFAVSNVVASYCVKMHAKAMTMLQSVRLQENALIIVWNNFYSTMDEVLTLWIYERTTSAIAAWI